MEKKEKKKRENKESDNFKILKNTKRSRIRCSNLQLRLK